jgi:hypothetical protein
MNALWLVRSDGPSLALELITQMIEHTMYTELAVDYSSEAFVSHT